MKLTEEIAQAWYRLETDGDDWNILGEGAKVGYRARASMLVENVPRLRVININEDLPSWDQAGEPVMDATGDDTDGD